MLKITDLNQYYGESHTLWDVNLNIEQGSCTVIIGRNGVGKTTLLKSIMGILNIASGSIVFDKQELNRISAHARAHLGIGYVPQGRDIFPRLTVEENLKIGLNARRDSKRKIPDLIYDLFPVLESMKNRQGGNLSGGQQQQLAIGRALVIDPKILILDEPTEGIQPNIVHEIGDIIIRLNRDANLTVVLIEQKLPFARRVAQQFALMDKGRSVASGAIQDLNDDLIKMYLSV